MIHKITPSLDYNKGLKRLDAQLNEPTNQNSIKVLKVVKPTNKKTLLCDFGDLCNKQPNVPSLPWIFPNSCMQCVEGSGWKDKSVFLQFSKLQLL